MTGTQISVLKALELVRNSETGEVHPGVDATLDREVKQIWSQIKTNPDYVMNKDEFAVFNYFQDRYKGEDLARKAVARFWNNFKVKSLLNNGWNVVEFHLNVKTKSAAIRSTSFMVVKLFFRKE
ncbi:hypothetical protein MMC34_006710 [Xylographa carneopallida]|nr:hypothetical protein [Xylographa carneopallida]